MRHSSRAGEEGASTAFLALDTKENEKQRTRRGRHYRAHGNSNSDARPTDVALTHKVPRTSAKNPPTKQPSLLPKTPVHPLAHQVPNRTPPLTWPTPSGALEDTYDMQNIHHIHEKRKTNTQTQTTPKRQGERKSVGGNGGQSREGRRKILGFPRKRGNAQGNAGMPEGTRERSRECGNARGNAGTLQGTLGARERDGRFRMNISGFTFPA